MVQPKKVRHKYKDLLVLLVTGEMLIGRVLVNGDPNDHLVVYKPAILEFDEDANGTHLFPWISQSSDEFYSIPRHHIITISEPEDVFSKTYVSGFINVEDQSSVKKDESISYDPYHFDDSVPEDRIIH